MSGFEAGEDRWIEGLGNLGNVVRQEVIARQLDDQVVAELPALQKGQSVSIL
jgi:hypothetical protein